jgi:hypothetical protein
MAKDKDRHGWLRGALSDAGLRQKDISALWKCDEAVVSRFVKTGEPALTFERGKILADKLHMSLDELNLRLEEGLAPRKSARAAALTAPTAPARSEGGDPANVQEAIADAKAAVQRLREFLPDAKIIFQIDLGEL